MNAFTKALRCIDKLNEYAYIGVSLLFVPLTCISMVEVAMRYMFNRPTIWAWDINVQLFSAIVVFGAGHTLFLGGHVTMDIIISRFSKKTQLACSLGTYLVFFFSMALVLVKVGGIRLGFPTIGGESIHAFAPPVYPLKAGIFIGMTLLFLQAISVFVRNLGEFTALLKDRGADR